MKTLERFCKKLQKEKIKYELINCDNDSTGVKVVIKGKIIPYLTVRFAFDDKIDDCVQIMCYGICKFSREKNLVMLQTANALNIKYRWLKFYLTQDGEVHANMDVAYQEKGAEELIWTAMRRAFYIVDEAYPILRRALLM